VDPLKELVGELFDYSDMHRTERSNFNAALKEWREINGDRSGKWSPSAVKRQLLNSGKVREIRPKGMGWVYEGIRLMSDPEQPMVIGKRASDSDASR
jgi:putative DNA primase/helicase